MAHRVVWSPRAVADVEAIEADSPAYARTVVRRIVNLTRSPRQFPRSGRKVPEFDDEQLRELIAYSYRIVYHVQAAEVVIAAVIHGKGDLTQQ